MLGLRRNRVDDRSMIGIVLAALISIPGIGIAENQMSDSSTPGSHDLAPVIVQIGGRFCEYLRPDSGARFWWIEGLNNRVTHEEAY